MKKFCLIVAVAIVAAACTESKVVDNNCNTKICDYLYGVEYDDYDFDVCLKAFENFLPPAAACSEARKGDFVGRNLDWYINREASAIIKINATVDHYASIGVVGSNPKFTNDIAALSWNSLTMFHTSLRQR